MANDENLKKGNPETEFSSGRLAVEEGRKGGLKKAENAKLNKTMEAIGQALANCEPTDELVEELKSKYPDIAGDVIDNKVLLVAKLFEEAIKGNIAAIAMFRDTIGEKPIDKTENKDIRIYDDKVHRVD